MMIIKLVRKPDEQVGNGVDSLGLHYQRTH